jgi:hypothetical protein
MGQVGPGLSQHYPGSISENLYFWKGGKLQRISQVEADTGRLLIEVTGDFAAAIEELNE